MLDEKKLLPLERKTEIPMKDIIGRGFFSIKIKYILILIQSFDTFLTT